MKKKKESEDGGGRRENERGRGREREKEERGFSTHPPVGLIVLDDCLRIMAETHNSDYNACSFNNAVTSRGVVYVNVPVRARRHRVRRLFRLRLSSSLTLLLSLLHSFSLFLRGTQPPPFSRHNHLVPSLFRDSLLGYSWRGPPSSTRGSATATAAPIMPGEVIDGSIEKRPTRYLAL